MNKKLILAVLLCLALTFSLTACSTSESDTGSESAQTESVSETSDESESVSESETEEDVEEETEETSVEDETESATVQVDISDAIDGSTTSIDSLIPFGEWGTVNIVSPADMLYHSVYVRLTNVTTWSEDAAYIQEAVALNNENANDWMQIDLDDYEMESTKEWHLVDYEVYIPEDFPALSYGTTEPSIGLMVTSLGDDLVSGNYRLEIEVYDDEDFMPGNVYAFKILYATYIENQDYAFKVTTYPADTELLTTETYDVYFASH